MTRTVILWEHALKKQNLSSFGSMSTEAGRRVVFLAVSSWEWTVLLNHTKQHQRLLKPRSRLQPPPLTHLLGRFGLPQDESREQNPPLKMSVSWFPLGPPCNESDKRLAALYRWEERWRTQSVVSLQSNPKQLDILYALTTIERQQTSRLTKGEESIVEAYLISCFHKESQHKKAGLHLCATLKFSEGKSLITATER